jgi:hypothetical protein
MPRLAALCIPPSTRLSPQRGAGENPGDHPLQSAGQFWTTEVSARGGAIILTVTEACDIPRLSPLTHTFFTIPT